MVSCGVVGECFGGMDSRLLGNDGKGWVGVRGVRGGRVPTRSLSHKSDRDEV